MRHGNLALFKEIQALYGWQSLETNAAKIHFWRVSSMIQYPNNSLCSLDQLCISGWAQNSTKRNTFLWPKISQLFRSIIEFTLSHNTLYFNYLSSFTLDICGDHFYARPRGAVVTKTQSPTTPLASQLIRQQVGGFSFDVGL